MAEFLDRTKLLLGDEAVQKLASSYVAIFGIGGVGGYACEALARSGVGRFDIIDRDVVDVTNINRQIIATNDTVGKVKVEVMKERIESINPGCRVNALQLFYLPETADEIHLGDYDYVVDAIDNVTAKLTLIENAYKEKVPIISAMGAGNKLDPSRFRVADIYSTSVCPLAKVMRRELKKRGITKLKVVYSDEEPIKSVPTASVPFVPPVAGLIMAGEVVKDLSLREADLP